MTMILTLAFLILFHQLLTGVTYVSSATVDCNENSVIVEDQGSRYQSVNLLVGNSYCQRIIQRDAQNAMKSMCLNITEAHVNERKKTLNMKIDAMEVKIGNLIQMIVNVINRCPPGYDYFEEENFCYKFNNECKTWSEARQICQKESGDLISLRSSILDFRNLLRSKSGACSMVWVGATDADAEGRWNWLNGVQVLSTIWEPGQPDNLGNNENCGNLASFTDYKMNDKDCKLEGNFICQIV